MFVLVQEGKIFLGDSLGGEEFDNGKKQGETFIWRSFLTHVNDGGRGEEDQREFVWRKPETEVDEVPLAGTVTEILMERLQFWLPVKRWEKVNRVN